MVRSARPPVLDRRTFLRVTGGTALVLPVAALAGCGSSSSGDARTVSIAFQQFGSSDLMRQYILEAAERFTADNPGYTVDLLPIVASENDYFTKNELIMSSPRTVTDVVYEDTFILFSDAEAGYLRPMEDLMAGWVVWEEYLFEAPKNAVIAPDGHAYAAPTHTDTRALWFHQPVFERAGLPADWAPGTWEELLETLRELKSAVPDVVPFMIYSGTPQGEKASMQGFEMLLFGTDSRLYDEEQQKWVIGTQGFIDSLAFIQTVFEEELTVSLSAALDPNIAERVQSSMFPAGELAVLLDGSWISQNWTEQAANPWPEWGEQAGLARMPTQHGQGKGWVTLAGGWSFAIPALAPNPEVSMEFIKTLLSTELALQRTITGNQITVRSDIAQHPEYQGYSPSVDFFTAMVDQADYRPAFAEYPQVSAAIQEAMGLVMTGAATPEEAAAAYDANVIQIVGADDTIEGE